MAKKPQPKRAAKAAEERMQFVISEERISESAQELLRPPHYSKPQWQHVPDETNMQAEPVPDWTTGMRRDERRGWLHTSHPPFDIIRAVPTTRHPTETSSNPLEWTKLQLIDEVRRLRSVAQTIKAHREVTANMLTQLNDNQDSTRRAAFEQVDRIRESKNRLHSVLQATIDILMDSRQ